MSDYTSLFHGLASDDTPVEVWTWDIEDADQVYLTIGQNDAVPLTRKPSAEFLAEFAALLRKAA